MNLPGDLVPRMRQELEELARIPGFYEIVDLQISIHKEDKEAETSEYKNYLKLGDKVKVSSPTGSTWMVNMVGYERKFSLHQETLTLSGGLTFSVDGFVEDGILKSEVWCKEWFSMETFRLDPRGCLFITLCLQTQYETLVLTDWTKRIYSKEPTGRGLFQVFVNTLKQVRDAINTTGLFE